MANSKEIDIKLESVDTTEEDLGTDVDKLVEGNSDSDSSSKQEQSNADTSSDKSDNVNTETVSKSSTDIGSQSSTSSGSPSTDGKKSENESSQDTTQSKIPEKAERLVCFLSFLVAVLSFMLE